MRLRFVFSVASSSSFFPASSLGCFGFVLVAFEFHSNQWQCKKQRSVAGHPHPPNFPAFCCQSGFWGFSLLSFTTPSCPLDGSWCCGNISTSATASAMCHCWWWFSSCHRIFGRFLLRRPLQSVFQLGLPSVLLPALLIAFGVYPFQWHLNFVMQNALNYFICKSFKWKHIIYGINKSFWLSLFLSLSIYFPSRFCIIAPKKLDFTFACTSFSSSCSSAAAAVRALISIPFVEKPFSALPWPPTSAPHSTRLGFSFVRLWLLFPCHLSIF